MIIVKATQDSEADVMPTEDLIAEMPAYHEELAKVHVHTSWSAVTVQRVGVLF
jgi:hypothetical protein